MEKEKVSVIITVYNIEDYIGACIESIQRQTYRNLEILLINDGSSDRSGEICDAYGKEDGRITALHRKNGGPSAAVNDGLSHMTGDFAIMVDGDDLLYDPFAIEHAMHLQKQYQADCVIYNHSYQEELPEEDTEQIFLLRGAEILRNLYIKDENYPGLYYVIVSRCTKLYKKELICKMRFPEGQSHEDEMAHRILGNAERVVYTIRKCYYYRIR